MKNILFTVLLSSALLVGCTQPSDLEQALQFAGENRAELEKVLEHYSSSPEDSLKYKATCFLIENMPYHYCLNSKQLDSFRVYILDKEPTTQTYKNFEKEYGSLSSEKYQATYDVQVITSDYLIRNIDFSFRLWEETPWGKYLSFDNFCEELLPYRVGNEPIEDWKEAYHNKYQAILDTAHYDKTSPVAAGKVIFNYLISKTEKDLLKWVFEYDWSTPNLGARTLLNLQYGSCQEQADMFTYAMRSVGIPCGIDMIVQYPDDYDATHWWNYMRDTSGLCVAFDYYYEIEVPTEKMTRIHKCGVVYRKVFGLQEESFPVKCNNKDVYPPLSLSNPFLKNVSQAYFYENPVKLPVGKAYKNGDVLYLSVFNNSTWVPVSFGEVKNGSIIFSYFEPEVLYQLSSYSPNSRVYKSESYPFILHEDGSVFFAKADTLHKQEMAFSRKFRFPSWWEEFHVNSTGGKFQGANRPDFSDSVTLYTIPGPAVIRFIDIYPENRQPFKYVRYLSGDGGYNMMAEVQFFSDDVQLQGEVIGAEGSYQDAPDKTKYSLFDSNILTYFYAVQPSGEWAGLAFDHPQKITHIRYWFRNDDNTVRPGDTYEFLYWGENDWVSMGTQLANDTLLHYSNIPSGTIYWLRDRTRGKEERPFTYEEQQQVWW